MTVNLFDHIFIYTVLILLAVSWVILARYMPRVPESFFYGQRLTGEPVYKTKRILWTDLGIHTAVVLTFIILMKIYRPLPMNAPAHEVLGRLKWETCTLCVVLMAASFSLNSLREALTGKHSSYGRVFASLLALGCGLLWAFLDS